ADARAIIAAWIKDEIPGLTLRSGGEFGKDSQKLKPILMWYAAKNKLPVNTADFDRLINDSVWGELDAQITQGELRVKYPDWVETRTPSELSEDASWHRIETELSKRDKNWGGRLQGALNMGVEKVDKSLTALRTEMRTEQRKLGEENSTLAKRIGEQERRSSEQQQRLEQQGTQLVEQGTELKQQQARVDGLATQLNELDESLDDKAEQADLERLEGTLQNNRTALDTLQATINTMDANQVQTQAATLAGINNNTQAIGNNVTAIANNHQAIQTVAVNAQAACRPTGRP
ncbi:MAG TPA: hypothetical protein VF169_10805, partial [Albitalea sp.]|uniref:hypothetical protein n=1 Tax=Piscinibacter sp. TaxID=1903157 RepID=UPI002ECFEF17